MTINQIYNLAIELGIKNDLRGMASVRKKLQKEKEKLKELKKDQQKEFDLERLTNPFSDTRFFTSEPNKKIKRVLTGIDIETPELLLARELSIEKKPIDLIISHHPIGKALAGLHEVMHLQVELLAKYGVPINIAEGLLKIRIDEVSRSVSPINHNRVVDAAQLLGLPLMCIHTPSDNLVANFLQRLLNQNRNKLETVGDIMKLLKSIPEYQKAIQSKAGPTLFVGTEDRFAGKIALIEITGGTEGSKDIFERLTQVGIGTVIGMHMKEENKKEAEKHHLNVIIAGHASSDSIGMNLFLDELEKRGMEVIPCSGLIRVKRSKAQKSYGRKTRQSKRKRRR